MPHYHGFSIFGSNGLDRSSGGSSLSHSGDEILPTYSLWGLYNCYVRPRSFIERTPPVAGLVSKKWCGTSLMDDASLSFDTLLHRRQGYDSTILPPMSAILIEFIGTQLVDDTNLVCYLPELENALDVLFEMQDSLLFWGHTLCSTGGAFKSEKCYWYMVDYECF